ncbi:MAG: KTSC domain-containing protein [Planctomycetaceae bacterium]
MRSVGYDQASTVLESRFPGGEAYRYFGIPSDVHRGLLTANSAGGYFYEYIRDAYVCGRVE